MADNTPVPLNRTERTLAFMIASIAGLSIIAIIAVIVAGASQADTSGSIWLTIKVFPAIGLIVAFVLIVVFAIVSILRRRRLSNGGD